MGAPQNEEGLTGQVANEWRQFNTTNSMPTPGRENYK